MSKKVEKLLENNDRISVEDYNQAMYELSEFNYLERTIKTCLFSDDYDLMINEVASISEINKLPENTKDEAYRRMELLAEEEELVWPSKILEEISEET